MLAFLSYHRQFPPELYKKYLKQARDQRYTLIPLALDCNDTAAIYGAMELKLIDLHKTFEYEEWLLYHGEQALADKMRLYREQNFSSDQILREVERQSYLKAHCTDDDVAGRLWSYRVEGDGVTITRSKGCAAVVRVPATLLGKPVTAIIPSRPRRFSVTAEVIRLPVTIKKYADTAFSRCPKLQVVEYEGTEEDWQKTTIYFSPLLEVKNRCDYEVVARYSDYIVLKLL